MILRDIARARENIQKSLAGVSTALTPGGLSGTSPSMASGAPWGEACRAAHRTAGEGALPPVASPSWWPPGAARLVAAAPVTPGLRAGTCRPSSAPISVAVPRGVGHHVVMVVQALSRVRFATPWTAARQASLSFTNSQSLLELMSTESVMPSNHLSLCRPFSSRLQSCPA